jgi:enoyl-CoA hydratase/carnithine racemase
MAGGDCGDTPTRTPSWFRRLALSWLNLSKPPQPLKPSPVGVNGHKPKVRFTQDGAVGTVTLDSSPLNLIGQELISDLLAAFGQVEAADGLRALVLRGEGKVFSAGADVAIFAGMSSAELRPLIGSFIDLGHRIERLPFPTLAAVHGTCMAGGFELALFCDLVWAAEGTMLGLPETRLGIVPLAGGVERVAARAGIGRARAVGLGGDLHTAEEFAAWGVIDRVVAGDELHKAAEEFANRLAAGPTRAFSVVKDLIRAYTTNGVMGADTLLTHAAVGLFDTEDARGGIESFLT